MSDFLLLEDGTSHLLLEDGASALLLESANPTNPSQVVWDLASAGNGDKSDGKALEIGPRR